MKRIGVWKFFFLLFLMIATVWIVRKANSPAPYRYAEGKAFGTIYHITYQADQDLGREISLVLDSVNSTFSLFDGGSLLSRINRGETNRLDEKLMEVVQTTERVVSKTNGAFDPTVAPLVEAWGFGKGAPQTLTAVQVDSLRRLTGYGRVCRLEGTVIRKAVPAVKLDFGAIAKGYGVDCVARMLRTRGCRNFLVEIGGEIVCNGSNADGQDWKIGVQRPDDATAELQTVLRLTDAAMATSGNYRNYYVKDGRRIAHTIDPRTGWPVSHSLLSATVVAPTCAEADALATAFMVLGTDSAADLVAADTLLGAYLIFEAGGKLQTKALGRLSKLFDGNADGQ